MILLSIIGGVMILLAFLYAGILLGALSGLALPARVTSLHDLNEPFVSVIIPVRNEEERIIQCLESLVSQDYQPDKFEVLISDDFSDDRTLKLVENFIQDHPALQCIIVTGDPGKHESFGKKSAIARAIEKASGTLIITTDGDTLHDPRWISSLARYYCETGAKMILGPVIFADENRVFQKLQTLEFLGVMGLTAGFANLGHPVMCNGANLCYEKEVFHEVGGFDGIERYASGDDQFLLSKIKQKYGGHSIRFLDDRNAIVTTLPEKEFGSFVQQRLRWISKSRGYRDLIVLFVGAVSYLFQAMIFTGFCLGFLSPRYLYLAVSLLCFKILLDFPLVFSMARFFNKRHLWPWYIPAQLFQIIYVTISGPIAFLVPVRWKGRRV
ncbi:MAG: glycosyltransferase [Bacteroidia bacterium]|nr:glycosyltransferase [Bacteroidia bacterium]